MTLPSDSVRLIILKAIQTRFQNIVQTDTSAPGYVPADTDWPFQFSSVSIGPLSDEDLRKRLSLGVVVGKETVRDQFPVINCALPVYLEFRVTVNSGDPSPGVLMEQVLTFIQRIVLLDRTWSGNAIETTFLENEVSLDTYADKSGVGVVNILIQYRHSHLDPRDASLRP